MPTTKDSINSTVSTTTTHFSQYMVVDCVKWYKNWEKSFNHLRKMWTGDTYEQKNLNTIFLIDCSTNTEEIDPIRRALEIGYNGVTEENYDEISRFITSGPNYEHYMKLFGKKICNRVDICENIISNKKYNDKGAVITFSNEVETNTGWSNSSSTLLNGVQRVHNDGSSSNINAAITEAMTLIDGSKYDAYRIVVITHSDISVANYLWDYNWARTDVNIVNLGYGSVMQYVENFTHHTGGEVYNSLYLNDLVSEEGETIYTPPKFIGEHSDEDGIPDIVEEYGLKPNGESIGTKIDKKDSDDDEIDDNVELHYFRDRLVYPLTPEQSRIMCSPVSDPTKEDSDDDGLLDGKAQYVGDKKVAPRDPNPMIINGPKGIWKAQIEEEKGGDIPTTLGGFYEYDYDFNSLKSVVDEINWGNLNGMNSLDIYNFVRDTIASTPLFTAMGSRALMFRQDEKGVLHSQTSEDITNYLLQKAKDNLNSETYALFITAIATMSLLGNKIETWQKIGGYNDLYDSVFKLATNKNMTKAKFPFSCNGDEYIVWTWRGDYLNLGSGAEIGIYTDPKSINFNNPITGQKIYNLEHWDCIDFTLPMTLNLYNYYGENNITNIFSWAPDNDQWWITGFNPTFNRPDVTKMVSLGSIDFIGREDMYDKLKISVESTPNLKDFMIFDEDGHTVWLTWWDTKKYTYIQYNLHGGKNNETIKINFSYSYNYNNVSGVSWM